MHLEYLIIFELFIISVETVLEDYQDSFEGGSYAYEESGAELFPY